MKTQAMEAGVDARRPQAVVPVELGPSSWSPDDPDSTDKESLTTRGLARLLNVSLSWATKNRLRVKGHFLVGGRNHRFDRETVIRAKLSGQVLEPKQKPVSLGLKRLRR